MKVTIEFTTDNDAFEEDLLGETKRILTQALRKIEAQLEREPGCVCTHPESTDKLLDSNGNTVGSVRAVREIGNARSTDVEMKERGERIALCLLETARYKAFYGKPLHTKVRPATKTEIDEEKKRRAAEDYRITGAGKEKKR